MEIIKEAILLSVFLAGFATGYYFYRRTRGMQDWEGIAADRAFTIAMQKVEIEQLEEKLAKAIYALATVPSVPTEEDIEWAKNVHKQRLSNGQN